MIEVLRQVAGVQHDVSNTHVCAKFFDAPLRQKGPDAATVEIASHHPPAEVSSSLWLDDRVATASNDALARGFHDKVRSWELEQEVREGLSFGCGEVLRYVGIKDRQRSGEVVLVEPAPFKV
ncbi:MAG TPA: hypothetical protein VK933_12590 [Longimicrobiales bacterium]|nr:hypothetical protein [Longimicrobiales bacterium]